MQSQSLTATTIIDVNVKIEPMALLVPLSLQGDGRGEGNPS